MMKLTILCLLVATALAMPVAENEKKDELPAPKSVVPLESKPTEAAVPNVARAIEAAEKKIEQVLPKSEEMKKDEMKKDEMKKDEMKKDEMKKDDMKKDEVIMKEDEKKLKLDAKKVEEEKKPIEEAKKLEEEKKPEMDIKSAEKHPEQAVVDNKDLIKETPLAGAVEVPAAAPGAAEVAIEPAQAKNIEETPLIIEKKSSEPAKELPKPDEMRVTREAEEAAKKLASEQDKTALEKLPADLSLKSAEAGLSEPSQAKAKEQDKPAIEAAVAEIEEARGASQQKKAPESIAEAKPVLPLKSEIAKEQRSEDIASGKVAAVENPVVEQRSEVIQPIAKEASVAGVEDVHAIAGDGAKEVAGIVAEKSAKLSDEVKAEELPLPQEVKDAKTAEPLAKSELPAETKEQIVPAEKKLPAEEKTDEKLVEKKEASSSEEKDDSSSEEKKMDEKKKDEEKKEVSSEEKDNSSEETKIKKEEMMKKEAVTAELSSSPAVGAIAAATGSEPKAPAS